MTPNTGPEIPSVIRLLPADLIAQVFLAEWNDQRAHITLHAREASHAALVQAGAEAALREAGVAATVSVRVHRRSEMAFPRSVEAWLRVFCSGHPVYDPTGVARRARGLLDVARAAKERFGDLIASMYFDPARREFLVRNRRRHMAVGPNALAEISDAISHAWSSDKAAAARVTVRSIDRLPNRPLIPVEDGPFGPLRGMLYGARMRLASAATALSLAAAIAPAAAKPDAHNFQTSEAAAQSDVMARQFGLLAGLSLFADDGDSQATTFARMGLDHYFGQRQAAPRIRSAQWRWFWEKEFWEPQPAPRNSDNPPYGGY